MHITDNSRTTRTDERWVCELDQDELEALVQAAAIDYIAANTGYNADDFAAEVHVEHMHDASDFRVKTRVIVTRTTES